MRLVCPNCDAEYEVDDSLVPAEGRDVQCSNCTTTWFQAGSNLTEDAALPEEIETEADEHDEGADLAAIAAATSAAAGLTPRKPSVDPEAMDVIHEEVARETAARKAEMGGIETQPDLGLDDSESETRASAARDRMVRRRGLEPQVTTIEDDDEALTAAPKREDPHAKKELFPDIEEINSTLSPEAAEAEAEAARLAAEGGETVHAQRSGFRLGFGLMLLFVVCLLLAYIYAPQLAQRAPFLSGALESYVDMVDGLRAWLDTAAQGLVEKIGVTLNDK
jgi:predicted Zn finger-like uncharacterized protein